MSSLLTIIGAIKQVASILKSALVLLEQYRDKVLEEEYLKKKNERAKLVAELNKAREEGSSDEVIRDIHNRMHDFDNHKLQ